MLTASIEARPVSGVSTLELRGIGSAVVGDTEIGTDLTTPDTAQAEIGTEQTASVAIETDTTDVAPPQYSTGVDVLEGLGVYIAGRRADGSLWPRPGEKD